MNWYRWKHCWWYQRQFDPITNLPSIYLCLANFIRCSNIRSTMSCLWQSRVLWDGIPLKYLWGHNLNGKRKDFAPSRNNVLVYGIHSEYVLVFAPALELVKLVAIVMIIVVLLIFFSKCMDVCVYIVQTYVCIFRQ